MVEHTFNNNDSTPNSQSVRIMDPMGQAAVLLVESLIHGLVARRVIHVAEALHMVDVAIDVIIEQSFDAGDHGDWVEGSLIVLERIRASLAIDLA